MNAFAIALHRRRARGLALFDVILAVGIIGSLIVGGVLLLQTVNERIKRNDTLALINTIRSETSRIYAGQPTLTGLDMDLLEKRGSLPDAVVRGAGSFKNAYDGDVTVAPLTGLRQFVIGLANLEDGACSDILTSWAGKTRSVSGIVSLGFGTDGTNTAVASPDTGVDSTDGVLKAGTGNVTQAGGAPVQPGTINGWCVETSGDQLFSIFLHMQA